MKKVFSFVLLVCLVCSSLTISSFAAAGDGVEQFNSIAQSIVDMDPDVSQEEVDTLLAQLEALDLDGEEEQNELTGSMVGTGDQSIQMLFAQLQLQLAQQNKQQATDRLNAIQAAQEQSRQVSEYINTARQLYSDAKNGNFKPVPEDMLQFLESNSLYIPNNVTTPDVKEWDAIIQSLENFQERVGSDMQQEMVYIQDFMGQYNQYTSQSSALYNAYSQQGLSGSATMLGMGGAGLMVTALVAGLAAGSLVTVLVLRRKQRAA